MTEYNEKQYLSETIDYDRDIAPYQFIKIFAGVGSGKNGFIDRLVQGGYFKHADGTSVEKQYVLLVTSRRSKMNEQLNLDNVVYDPAIGAFDEMKMNWLAFEPKYENYFDSPTIYLEDPDGWGEKKIFRRSCVNTNAKIQWNLRLNFKERYVETHPWERFDMIIIDEVHAVLSDASYQSSPFYVRRLIEETLKRSTKCKVIVMTGTPEVLKQYPLFDKAHLLDRMEECINVRPQSIEFITKKEAWEKQNEMLLQGQKFIAFFNHIGDVLELGKKYPESAAVSFSEDKKRKQLKANAEEVYNKMVETEKYIAENKHLPEGLTALLSTSKNKEGINIENEDIPVMFIEAHSRDEVVQMAGRVRVPVGKLYLIFNSPPQPNMENALEPIFSAREDVLSAVNRFFQEQCEQHGYPLFDNEACVKPVHRVEKLGKAIDYIHDKFPYIRFDYFSSMFEYYPERIISKAYYKAQQQIFKKAAQTEGGLITLAQQWYPGIRCIVSERLKQMMFKENKENVDQYLKENCWLNGERTIKQEERQKILADLMQILGIAKPDIKLKALLKKFGYELIAETSSKNANAPFRIEEKNH